MTFKYPYSFDPFNIPATLSSPMVEWFILFGITVAGKGAGATGAKLDEFLSRNDGGQTLHLRTLSIETYELTPSEIVQKLVYKGELLDELVKSKFGQYNRIEKAFRAVAQLDVNHLDLPTLERIVGPKTARMVILYSDQQAECVPLDTHVLKYLRTIGYADAPHSTPAMGRTYKFLEQAFVLEAKRQGKTVRQLDTEVWKSFAKEVKEPHAKEDPRAIVIARRDAINAVLHS